MKGKQRGALTGGKAFGAICPTILCAVGLALFCGRAQARVPERALDSLRQMIATRMRIAGIPGLSVAVALDSDIVFSGGFGLADIAAGRPVETRSIFRIASVSKPITAVAVMQLAEQGSIDLDAPIQRYCPDYPPKRWPVTARMLLSHMAGVRHYVSPEEFGNIAHCRSVTESITAFKNDSLLFEPGSAFHYSSYGYALLGCVVEGASGMSYTEYVRRRIFDPIGMIDTYTALESLDSASCARAYGRAVNGMIVNALPIDISDRIPGGGILSTAEDLVRFASALRRGDLINKSLIDTMFSPRWTTRGVEVRYGFGWLLAGSQGMVLHDGSQFGVRSLLVIVPEHRLCIGLLANLEGEDAGGALATIAEGIVAIIRGARDG